MYSDKLIKESYNIFLSFKYFKKKRKFMKVKAMQSSTCIRKTSQSKSDESRWVREKRMSLTECHLFYFYSAYMTWPLVINTQHYFIYRHTSLYHSIFHIGTLFHRLFVNLCYIYIFKAL